MVVAIETSGLTRKFGDLVAVEDSRAKYVDLRQLKDRIIFEGNKNAQ
jgi:hypothetical protein